jgi:hypothetical protein
VGAALILHVTASYVILEQEIHLVFETPMSGFQGTNVMNVRHQWLEE